MGIINKLRREDKTPRNPDRFEDDDCCLRSIKLEVSNFDNRLNPQYYLDWIISLERYFKWYEISQKWHIRGEYVLLP